MIERENPAPPQSAWTDWGGDGPSLCFGHANGIPPATYSMLLFELSPYFHVTSFAARPLWPDCEPDGITSWNDLAGDFRRVLNRRQVTGAVAIGHSLGSVLNILAAADDPSLFRAMVLIDPVVFSGWRSWSWGLSKYIGFGGRLPLVKGARRRRDRFPDLDAVRDSYSGKAVFSTWKPEVLEDYIRAAFEEGEGGEVVLRYSKAWEARIFELTPASVWRELGNLSIPMLFMRGGSSDTFLEGAANRVRRDLKTARVVELASSSHFVPMEHPQEVADLIVNWARENEILT